MVGILVVCIVAYCAIVALLGPRERCTHNVRSLRTAENRWWWECFDCGKVVG